MKKLHIFLTLGLFLFGNVVHGQMNPKYNFEKTSIFKVSFYTVYLVGKDTTSCGSCRKMLTVLFSTQRADTLCKKCDSTVTFLSDSVLFVSVPHDEVYKVFGGNDTMFIYVNEKKSAQINDALKKRGLGTNQKVNVFRAAPNLLQQKGFFQKEHRVLRLELETKDEKVRPGWVFSIKD